jgi:hypothetical protein
MSRTSLLASVLVILSSSASSQTVYDDFNGAAINPALWTGAYSGFSQSGGFLHLTDPFGAIVSSVVFSGDFDTVLDWQNFAGQSASPSCPSLLGLEVFRSPGFPAGGSMRLETGPSSNIVFHAKIWDDANSTSVESFHSVPAAGVTAGRLGISRVGATGRCYYDIGAGWVFAGEVKGLFTESVYLAIEGEAALGGGSLTVDLDWVTMGPDCNSACGSKGGSTYCTAGVSASGCQASISASGTASASAPSGFSLNVASAEGARDGLFFFGTSGRQSNSWGTSSSYQCVMTPVKRGGVLQGSGTQGLCDGTFSQDLNALWCPSCPKPQKNPGAGAWVQAQLWYRDPANTSNQTTGFSNAIEFLVGP